ncbi:hypothetical protein GCM10007421_29630 [Halopseudomonas oceani]|nr:hypothetical protein GCM10007421_29630 [Halopseudomonas oceani]
MLQAGQQQIDIIRIYGKLAEACHSVKVAHPKSLDQIVIKQPACKRPCRQPSLRLAPSQIAE